MPEGQPYLYESQRKAAEQARERAKRKHREMQALAQEIKRNSGQSVTQDQLREMREAEARDRARKDKKKKEKEKENKKETGSPTILNK